MLKKLFKKEWFQNFLVFVACSLFRLAFLTWRKKIIFHPEFQKIYDEKAPLCVAYWHQDIFATLYLLSKFKVVSMASDHHDGALIAKSIQFFGGEIVRGSSRRGAIKALKAMLRMVKETNLWPVITVDGPMGPRNKVKPGILEVARIGDLYVAPLAVYASKKWILKKTWDQTEIPKPFSKVTYYFGPPFESKTLDPKSESDQNRLADAINDAQQQAAKNVVS